MKQSNHKKMESKKPTKAQIENRIRNAIIHVDKTKNTKSIYFDDKGLRLVVTDDYAIVETGFHRHVFNRITSSGVSRPYLYLESFIDIAQAHESSFVVDDANHNKRRSYVAFMNALQEESKNKEDKSEYNICWYVDKWFDLLFAPLYAIGEGEISSFLLYESWVHNIARNSIIFEEKKEDMTNKQFIDNVCDKLKTFTSTIEERVLFEKKTDEQVMQENIDAMAEHEHQEEIGMSSTN